MKRADFQATLHTPLSAGGNAAQPAAPVAAEAACRLCGGTLRPRFTLTLLARHRVAYLACGNCGSLQTETPYWLDQAYGQNLSSLDTGAAQRNLRNLAATHAVARVYGVRNLLDMGGGDGLLCRLLRDTGLNAYVQDRYARPTYAQGFDRPDFAVADMITAFEVFEHLPQPRQDLDAFFGTGPRLVLVSTELYAGQDERWWYLSAESGQHVFFYSRQALQQVGRRYGYRTVFSGEFVLFVRADVDAGWRRALAGLLLRRKMCRLVAARLMLRATPGIVADFERLRGTAGSADRPAP